MRIAVVQLGRIGDMILQTPIFKIIKEKYPDSLIDVISGRHNNIVLKNNPRINEIIVYEKNPVKLLSLIMKLRNIHYDYWIDPKNHYSTESKFLAKISKAKYKVGFNRENEYIFNVPLLKTENDNQIHFTRSSINALKILNIEQPRYVPLPELYPSKEDIDNSNKFFDQYASLTKVLINFSAGSENRRWDIRNWISFVNSNKNLNMKFFLINSPKDQFFAEEIIKKCPKLIPIKTKSILDVAAIINKVDLVITPDTSIVHIASGYNKPIICLYSNNQNNFERFKPLSDVQFVVRSNSSDDTLSGITPDELERVFRKAININLAF